MLVVVVGPELAVVGGTGGAVVVVVEGTVLDVDVAAGPVAVVSGSVHATARRVSARIGLSQASRGLTRSALAA